MDLPYGLLHCLRLHILHKPPIVHFIDSFTCCCSTRNRIQSKVDTLCECNTSAFLNFASYHAAFLNRKKKIDKRKENGECNIQEKHAGLAQINYVMYFMPMQPFDLSHNSETLFSDTVMPMLLNYVTFHTPFISNISLLLAHIPRARSCSHAVFMINIAQFSKDFLKNRVVFYSDELHIF